MSDESDAAKIGLGAAVTALLGLAGWVLAKLGRWHQMKHDHRTEDEKHAYEQWRETAKDLQSQLSHHQSEIERLTKSEAECLGRAAGAEARLVVVETLLSNCSIPDCPVRQGGSGIIS